jgi:hypothetical protein
MSTEETNVAVDSASEETVAQVNVDARGKVLADEDRTVLENHITEIRNFLADNRDVTDWSSEKKDEAYKEVTEKWNVFQKSLRNVEYNYFATKKEYKFLRNLIVGQMSYGPNEIFVAMRVRDNVINVADKALQTIGKNDRFSFKVKIDDLTIAYHLIEKYQVKGLGEEAFHFANTLKTIGDISIIFNSFDKTSKQLSEEIGNWCAGLDPVEETAADASNTEAPQA